MKSTIKIICPSCGANSVFKLNETEYKCNYCQTIFLLNNTNKQDNIFKSISVNIPESTKINTKPINKIGCIFTVVGFVISISFSIGIFLFVGENSNKVDSIYKSKGDWQEPTIDKQLVCYEKGKPYIVAVLKSQTNKLDSAQLSLISYDPTNKRILNKKLIFKDNWHDLTFENNFNFFYANDLFYCTDNDSGLIAFKPNSLNQVIFSKTLLKKFPELKDGISKCEKQYDLPIVNITTNIGTNYFYNLNTDELIPQNDYSYFKKVNTKVISTVFFTEDENPYLVLATKTINEHKIENNLYLSDTANINKISHSKNKPYGIQSIKLLSNKIYFKPQIYGRYNDGLVFCYKQNLAKTAKAVLTYIDKNGKVIWENNSKELKNLLLSNGEFNNTISLIKKDFLYLTVNKSPTLNVCFNLINGEIIWVVNVKEVINEK